MESNRIIAVFLRTCTSLLRDGSAGLRAMNVDHQSELQIYAGLLSVRDC